MTVLSVAAGVVIAVLIDTIWMALFRAHPVGKFKVLRDSDQVFTFASNAGTFTIDSNSKSLSHSDGKERGSVPFSEIKDLEFRANVKYAALQELFFGFNFTDLFTKYQDTVEWFSITLLTKEGKRIPLFLSGQYRPREFLLGWYIELQADILSRLGLLQDVEQQSRSAFELISARICRESYGRQNVA